MLQQFAGMFLPHTARAHLLQKKIYFFKRFLALFVYSRYSVMASLICDYTLDTNFGRHKVDCEIQWGPKLCRRMLWRSQSGPRGHKVAHGMDALCKGDRKMLWDDSGSLDLGVTKWVAGCFRITKQHYGLQKGWESHVLTLSIISTLHPFLPFPPPQKAIACREPQTLTFLSLFPQEIFLHSCTQKNGENKKRSHQECQFGSYFWVIFLLKKSKNLKKRRKSGGRSPRVFETLWATVWIFFRSLLGLF